MAIILGIDPGYERIGIAILKKENGKETLIYSDCFKTPNTTAHHERLKMLGEEISKIIESNNPDTLAIENLFFAKNTKTAMLVAEARGVILYEASKKKLKIKEFMPSHVKMAVTGSGNADKKAVIKMVDLIIKPEKKKMIDDEYDAIAIALACSASSR